MTRITVKVRTKSYNISVDDVLHTDGSTSRIISCNGHVIFAGSQYDFPKCVQSVISNFVK